ncbi:MAG: hypothetical protein HYZ58_10170 [Acidobacteria bacterium]|nr:hypothetical protein [Acidobacteriota bacterium]
MEVSDVRRRLQQELERGRVAHAERRARNDAAARSYADFLSRTATPVFRMLITALKAEGFGSRRATSLGRSFTSAAPGDARRSNRSG